MVSIFVLFYFVFYNFCSRAGIGVFLEVSMEGVINFCFLFSGIGSCWGSKGSGTRTVTVPCRLFDEVFKKAGSDLLHIKTGDDHVKAMQRFFRSRVKQR